MGALSSTQSSNSNQTTKMKSLLVCFSVVAVALAAEENEAPAAVLPALGYPYAAYPYAYGHGALAPAAYTMGSPVQYKYVPKEVEIEVKTFQPELIETGCANSFGTPVPCFQAGEARKRRSAEEVAAATPAATLPLAYAGYPYAAGLPYAHAGLGYAAYPHVTYAKPVVQEVEVPTPVYKNVVEKVPLQPLCQNHLGLAVPCL